MKMWIYAETSGDVVEVYNGKNLIAIEPKHQDWFDMAKVSGYAMNSIFNDSRHMVACVSVDENENFVQFERWL